MKNMKILLIVVLGISTPIAYAQETEGTTNKDELVVQQQDSIKKESFKVYGNCEMCKKKIERAAKKVNGVKSATWNVESKIVTIQYDEYMLSKNGKSIDNVSMKIAEAGYDNQYYKAEDKAYNALPKCCQYERFVK